MKFFLTGILALTLNLYAPEAVDAATEEARQMVSKAPNPVEHTSAKNNNSDKKYLGRLHRTAVFAAVMTALTAGLYAASDVMFFYEHDTPARSMGLTGLGLTAGLTPMFYLSNRSAFRHFGSGGVRALQVWGWVFSSLAVADVLGVVIAGLGAAINPLYGLMTLAGVFTAASFTLFAVDGFRARKQIRAARTQGQPTVHGRALLPFVSEVVSPSGRHRGAVMGITGKF